MHKPKFGPKSVNGEEIEKSVKDAIKEMEIEDSGSVLEIPENTKEKINRLLWETLPDNVTLRRMESLAIHIYDLIRDEWENV